MPLLLLPWSQQPTTRNRNPGLEPARVPYLPTQHLTNVPGDPVSRRHPRPVHPPYRTTPTPQTLQPRPILTPPAPSRHKPHPHPPPSTPPHPRLRTQISPPSTARSSTNSNSPSVRATRSSSTRAAAPVGWAEGCATIRMGRKRCRIRGALIGASLTCEWLFRGFFLFNFFRGGWVEMSGRLRGASSCAIALLGMSLRLRL